MKVRRISPLGAVIITGRNPDKYLGIWEKIHNPDFNYGEFDLIRSQAGLHSYKISVKEWVAKTNAIGLGPGWQIWRYICTQGYCL